MPNLMQPWDVYMVRFPARHPADDPIIAQAPSPGGGDSSYRYVIDAAARRSALRRAVRVATPSLAAVLDNPQKAASLSAAQLRRAALSVIKYDIRMRTRPTPFGLFAGVAIGSYDARACVRVATSPRARIQPDMGWLLPVVHRLQLHPEILQLLRVQTTTPLVVRGDRIHFDSPASVDAKPGDLTPTTVRVRLTPAIHDIVCLADRPIPVSVLIGHMVQSHGGQPEAVLRLIRGLCERGLLLTDLRPQLDGADPLTHVITRLAVVNASMVLPTAARGDVDGLRRVDQLRAAVSDPGHDQDEAFTRLLAAAREVEAHDTPLHIDLAMGTQVTLPTSVRDDAAYAVDLMRQLAPARLGMRSLRRWHCDFLERYGVDRLVPVLEALDPAAGLGAPAGYEWPPSELADEDTPPDRDADLRHDRILADLVARSHRDRLREVVLDEPTVEALATNPAAEHTQRSCELYALLAASSVEAVTNGSYRLVVAPNPGSHQAGATFGRFLGLFDAKTRSALVAAANIPTAPVTDALTVSLAYQPRSPKAANIAHAPVLPGRRIGIGLISPEQLSPDDDVQLKDLAVGATLDRLYVVHVPTGRELVPTTQTMLSPGTQAPNVARFLFEIGLEGQRLWEPWDWGPAGAAPYLPRVRVDRVILCPATWKLDALRDAATGAPTETDPALIGDAIDRWRDEWDVPDLVVALSSDQRLTLDLTDPWHQLLLWTETRRDSSLVVQESPAGLTQDWFTADGLPARPVELVIPMSRASDVPKQNAARVAAPPQVIETGRRRPPGSEWVYVRVNTPIGVQNELLRQHLPQLVADMEAAGADAWFFLRYSIPQHHLRIRWHLQPEADLTKALMVLSDTVERWHTHRLAGDWTLDAYEPEWERYGGPTVQQHVERVFHADSVACLRLLMLLSSPDFTLSDDEVTAVSMAAAALAFGPPASGSAWVDHAQGSVDAAAAWLAGTGVPRDVPAEIRRRRAHWQRLIDPAGNWPHLRATEAGNVVLVVLAERDTAVSRYADALRTSLAGGHASAAEVRAVGSLLHMTFNRLIGGPPEREQAALAAARMATNAHWERRMRQPCNH